HRPGAQQRRWIVHARPAAARGAARPGLRHPGAGPEWERQARPAARGELRWRAAFDRADERELRPPVAWRWQRAVYSGAGDAERLPGARTGPRYPAGPDPSRRPLRRDPEQ